MKNSRRVQTHHCAYTPLLNSANNNIITQSTPFCNEPLPQFVKAIASIHQQCEFYDHILRGSKHPIFDSVRGLSLLDGQFVTKPHPITNHIVVNDATTLPCLFSLLFSPKNTKHNKTKICTQSVPRLLL